MQSFLERLAANLVIAAFVPALIFASIIILFFLPIMPQPFLVNLDKLADKPIILLSITLVVGTFLLYTREIIYAIYRGRFMPSKFSYFEIRIARQKRAEIERRKEEIEKLEIKVKHLEQELKKYPKMKDVNAKEAIKTALENSYSQLAKQEQKRRSLLATYKIEFPPTDELFLPTRFGNILAAAEAYPFLRYRIDASSIWPRLSQIIPDRDFQKIEDANNQLFFLVNCSLLSLATAFICSLVGFYHLLLWRQTIHIYLAVSFLLPIQTSQIYLEAGIAYLIGCSFSLVSFYLFYRASLPSAKYYGSKYCVAFDLFRFQLLETFHHNCPEDSDDEKFTWGKFSEFIGFGEDLGLMYFEYSSNQQSNKTDSEV